MKFFIWSSIFIVIPLFRSIFVCFVSFSHGGRLACVWCVRPTAAIAIISSTCRSACYMLRIRYVVCTCRCQLIYLFEFRLSREPSCVVCIKYIPVTCWLLKRFLFFFLLEHEQFTGKIVFVLFICALDMAVFRETHDVPNRNKDCGPLWGRKKKRSTDFEVSLRSRQSRQRPYGYSHQES